MTAATKWTIAIVGLLLVNVLAGVFIAVAAHHHASQVVPGYSEKP